MKPKILITAKAHPVLQKEFQSMGFDVDVNEKITYNELIGSIHDYTGLVVTTRLQIDADILSKANKLKWIGRLGSGMEMIDVDFALTQGIQCFSSPEGNRDSVGEQAIGMLLNLMHNIKKSSDEVCEGRWIREENRGYELGGKKVGIIGFGNTGSAFAQRLASFDVTVLAHDKYKSGFTFGHVVEASLEKILIESDVIGLHLPLNNETTYYANSLFFSSMKKQPFFLNLSRGGVVNTAALIEALDQKMIRGAALDVLENEDVESYSLHEKSILANLCARTNVLVTPHIAGYSHESLFKMATVLLDKLKKDFQW
jgi:D-3-phosphoglycerate dehydrogenase